MPDRTTDGDESRYRLRRHRPRRTPPSDVLRGVGAALWRGAAAQRSGGRQRLYSEEDVHRLTLLRRATQAGHSIAEVARLRTEALEALVDESHADALRAAPDAESAVVRVALAATERLDGPALERTLKRAALALGTGFVDRIAPRFLTAVGERWHEGAMSPARRAPRDERRQARARLAAGRPRPAARAPRLVVATPADEHHELGAMLSRAGATARNPRLTVDPPPYRPSPVLRGPLHLPLSIDGVEPEELIAGLQRTCVDDQITRTFVTALGTAQAPTSATTWQTPAYARSADRH